MQLMPVPIVVLTNGDEANAILSSESQGDAGHECCFDDGSPVTAAAIRWTRSIARADADPITGNRIVPTAFRRIPAHVSLPEKHYPEGCGQFLGKSTYTHPFSKMASNRRSGR